MSFLSALLLLGCTEKAGSPSCTSGSEVEESERVCLTSVTGQVVDEDAEPVAGLPVTVCGPVCFRGETGTDGRFLVEIDSYVIARQYSVQPHGSPSASTFYYPLPDTLKSGSHEAGVLRVIPLPKDGDLLVTKTDLGGEQAPAQSVASQGVRLTIGERTIVRTSVADALSGEEGRRFRAQELSSDLRREFAPELAPARVIALGPFEADFQAEESGETKVALSIDNTQDWEAGSSVEVLALGTYLDPSWLAPSEFEAIGEARVSEDGATIELSADADGAGLRYITWIALRPDVR